MVMHTNNNNNHYRRDPITFGSNLTKPSELFGSVKRTIGRRPRCQCKHHQQKLLQKPEEQRKQLQEKLVQHGDKRRVTHSVHNRIFRGNAKFMIYL